MDNAIVEKLRKLLTLADASRGGTQAEMETAMAKAKELAMRHAIDLASIELDRGKDISSLTHKIESNRFDNLEEASRRTRVAYRHIFHLIQELFDVQIISHTRRGPWTGIRICAITMFGETTDVALCKEILPWLLKLFPKSCGAEASRLGVPNDAAFYNGFYFGMSAGILEAARRRAKEQLTANQAQCYALVVRSKEEQIAAAVAEAFPSLSRGRSRGPRTTSSLGYSAGHAKGKQLNLNQVGGGSAERRQLQ